MITLKSVSEDYVARADAMERRAKRKFELWTKTLDSESKSLLKRDGIENIAASRVSGGMSHSDPAQSNEASYSPDLTDLDTLADRRLEETSGMSREDAIRYCAGCEAREAENQKRAITAEAVKSLAANLITQGNIELSVYGLCFALGFDVLEGVTQTSVAVKLKVTRAYVSKATRFWTDFYDLPPSAYMRGDEACENYSQAQIHNHWRNRFKPKTKAA